VFRPDFVIRLLTKLSDAGFLLKDTLRSDIQKERAPKGPFAYVVHKLKFWGNVRWTIRNVDKLWTSVYNIIGKYFCSKAAIAFMVILGAIGFADLIFRYFCSVDTSHLNETLTSHGSTMLLFLLPMILIDTLLHESGHAIATKHAGCKVNGMGVGWHAGPIFFIDTSDSWLAPKVSRIAISAAGPLVNWIVAGVTVLLSYKVSGMMKIILIQFALSNYIDILINLNPMMKLDGYYILIDMRPLFRLHLFIFHYQIKGFLKLTYFFTSDCLFDQTV